MKREPLRRDSLIHRSVDDWLALVSGVVSLALGAILFFDFPVSRSTQLALGIMAGVLLAIALWRDIRRRWRSWRDEDEL